MARIGNLAEIIKRAFWTKRNPPKAFEKLAIRCHLFGRFMAKDLIAKILEIYDIIDRAGELKNNEVLAHPTINASSKRHYFDSNSWPLRQTDKLFELSLPQVLFAIEPMNHRLVNDEEEVRIA